MGEVYIVSAARTPIGKFQGTLGNVKATQLGTVAAKAALERAGIAADKVDEVLFGNVLQAGLGQNPARQVLRGAGVPDSVAATTINKVCGSGLESVMLAARAIKAGDAQVVLAGGMESMTQAPYMLPKARDGYRLGNGEIVDSMVADGLWDVYNDYHMGNTGELTAEKYEISREQQDEWAAKSHQRASAAMKAGKFAAEIAPVEIPKRKGDPFVFNEDEGVRHDASAEGMAKLKPVFKPDGGTVTAGNASQISDGAAAVVVASEEAVKQHGLKPLARITGYSSGGMAPEWVMMAPVEAVKNLEAKTGLKRDSFDLYEFNEAFSSQACALPKVLELDSERINVHGGAVALGHPIGASGARILTTLLYALKDRDAKTGLASLCLGGGNAVAMSVELQ